eukprot:TRINITY_DN108961_c0_g1_i1.p1 TRINITY_DN108961_c0_g1~~TRINITY_DN108961_c0_g1_i1.p1  ORF type:complete len:716 (-),score=129.18 TRINITY_DN108961_c0_g1_i1:63-2210(-)
MPPEGRGMLRRIASSCDGMVFAARMTNALMGMVCAKTVMWFLALDLVMSLGAATYFWIFPNAALVGRLAQKWKVYFALAMIRAMASLAGIAQVMKRNHSGVRMFFGWFMFSVILLIFLMNPILLLECSCRTGWYQCSAVQAFTADGLNIYYQVPPNEVKEWTPGRNIKNADPPREFTVVTPPESLIQAEAASVEHQEHQEHRKQAMSKRALSRYGDLLEPAVEASKLAPSKKVATSRRQDIVQKMPRQNRKALSFVQMPLNLTHLREPLEAASLGQRKAAAVLCDKEYAFDPKELAGSLLETRNFTVAALESRLSDLVADKISKEVRQTVKRVVSTWISKYCETHKGSSTSIDVAEMEKILASDPIYKSVAKGNKKKENDAGKDSSWDDDWDNFDLAPNIHVPVKTHTPAGHNKTHDDDEEEEWPREPDDLRLDQKTLLSLDNNEAMSRIGEHYRKMCRCSNTTSCMYFEGATEKTFWCYIDQESVDACHKSSVEVMKDTKTGQYWSKDLCEQRKCSCSGLGEMPNYMDSNLNVKGVKALEQNQIHFGSYCAKWHTYDKLEWCFVGYDSTCVERIRLAAPSSTSSSWPQGLPRQMSSVATCDSNNLWERMRLREPVNHCFNLKYFMEVVFLLHMLLCMPMTVIIFKFVANRCGDTFEVEEHFAVISSDEESDGEDWAANSKKKEGGAQSSGAQSSAGAPAAESKGAQGGDDSDSD